MRVADRGVTGSTAWLVNPLEWLARLRALGPLPCS
jgi:hypothetical protein